jgi:hypothetical protein
MAPSQHHGFRLGPGGEVVPGENLVLEGGENDSAAALSKHDPTRPIDWRMPSRAHKAVNPPAV